MRVLYVDDDPIMTSAVVRMLDSEGFACDTADLGKAAVDLANFMVPREVFVVDALPMTTTGKVIRHRLAVLGDRDRV